MKIAIFDYVSTKNPELDHDTRMEAEALLRLANLETLEILEVDEIDYQNYPLPWQDSIREDNKDYYR